MLCAAGNRQVLRRPAEQDRAGWEDAMALFKPKPALDPSDLDASRGLMLACVLSLLLWLVLVYVLERLLV